MPRFWPHDTLARLLVVWGAITTLALFVTYAAVQRWLDVPVRELWLTTIGLGWAYTLWASRDWWRPARSTRDGPDTLAGIWTGLGLTGTLIALLALYAGAVDLPTLGGVGAALLGFGFFASGSVAGRGQLRFLAVGWWVGSLAIFLWPGVHSLLVLAALILVLQVAPAFGAGVAVPFAATFFLASEGLEHLLAVETPWLGLAAAGALTLALRPLERVLTERLAGSPTPYTNGVESMDAPNDGPNAYDDLTMVRRLMEETRELVYDHGKHFIVWGLLGVIALLATYARAVELAALPIGWIWAAALAVGWTFSFWAGWRDSTRARVRTTAARLLGGIWIGFGITATLVAVLGLYTRAIEPQLLGGLESALLGFALFATSFVGRQSWLRWLALGWWAGSLAMFVWPGAHTLPIMAGMMLVLMVVPGLIIRNRGRPAVQKQGAGAR